MKEMDNQVYVMLNDGNKIPQLGLGVFQIEGDEATRNACLDAFKVGIRHIDTAHSYQNERGVGQAVLQVECHPYFQQTEQRKRIA